MKIFIDQALERKNQAELEKKLNESDLRKEIDLLIEKLEVCEAQK
jgi:hypothetical protein